MHLDSAVKSVDSRPYLDKLGTNGNQLAWGYTELRKILLLLIVDYSQESITEELLAEDSMAQLIFPG